MRSTITTIDLAVERLYELNPSVVGSGAERHERPHKPLLFLVVLDLIADGKASPSRIPWSDDLRTRFTAYFVQVRMLNDTDTPENPFLYLRQSRFWEPVQAANAGGEHPLERTPTVADFAGNRVFARLVDGMENFVSSPAHRTRLRDAIVARYFPAKRASLEPLFRETAAAAEPDPSSARVAEEPAIGRNPAFRRKVLEVYDSQCAVCGLRIKLPGSDLTFVDGAHLVPFTESRNDHPTNGIALCKNHHWAMDRFLIVPTPDLKSPRWKTSPLLDARRSPGEKMLLEFDNHEVLRPHDEAFRPALASLQWRFDRLLTKVDVSLIPSR